MEAKMNEELLSILKKYIPEQSIGLIKDELIAAEQLRKDKKELEYKLEVRETEMITLNNRISVLESDNNRLLERDKSVTKLAEEVAARELACDKRERNWELELIKKDLQCEKDKQSNLAWITSLVFASPIYRQTVTENLNGTIHKYGQSVPYNQMQSVVEEHQHIVRPAMDNPNQPSETIATVGR